MGGRVGPSVFRMSFLIEFWQVCLMLGLVCGFFFVLFGVIPLVLAELADWLDL